MNTSSVTGIPLDILFLSIGALLSTIGIIAAWLLRNIIKAVSKLQQSAIKRDKRVSRISLAMRLVCKKLDIPIPFNGDDYD